MVVQLYLVHKRTEEHDILTSHRFSLYVSEWEKEFEKCQNSQVMVSWEFKAKQGLNLKKTLNCQINPFKPFPSEQQSLKCSPEKTWLYLIKHQHDQEHTTSGFLVSLHQWAKFQHSGPLAINGNQCSPQRWRENFKEIKSGSWLFMEDHKGNIVNVMNTT